MRAAPPITAPNSTLRGAMTLPAALSLPPAPSPVAAAVAADSATLALDALAAVPLRVVCEAADSVAEDIDDAADEATEDSAAVALEVALEATALLSDTAPKVPPTTSCGAEDPEASEEADL